jgi:hypothetical protein
LQWVMAALEQKTASLARLRRMIFGEKTEKACKILPATIAAILSGPPKPKAKGHGRNGAKDYLAAQRVQVPHPQHKAGDLCPKCLKAKLYLFTTPARLVHIVAQPIFQATVFELERLRCALCGALFTAPAPPEAGLGKYDPSVGNMLALMRYGAGLPMYRTDKWQNHFGVPLPASTQWELIEAASEIPEVIYETLIGVAAQGHLLFNDDTHSPNASFHSRLRKFPNEPGHYARLSCFMPTPGPGMNHASRAAPRFSEAIPPAPHGIGIVSSGKEVALPPLPPLGTGREGFPSSGSSRCKAPLARSRQSQQSYSHTQVRGAENFSRRSRAEKYSDHRSSNGLASPRILTCRRKRKCLANARRNHTVLPSLVRALVGAANVHAVFPGQWKYRLRIHSLDFPRCLRLAHCHNRRHISKSARPNV